MLRISTFTALCLFAGTALANSILQGNQELGVSGIVDFDTVDDTLVELNLSYGYFPLDYLETGVHGGIRDDSRSTQWNLGGFVEYHFDYGSYIIPYIGVSLDLAGAKVQFGEIDDDTSAVVLGTEVGAKCFLNTNVALATALGYDYATDKVFPAHSGAEDTNWTIEIGLRFYF